MPELAGRECPTDNSFVVELDFLYWRGQNHAPIVGIRSVSTGTFPIELEMLRHSQKWEPGFRIGIGWDTVFDTWDLMAHWTYYHNHSRESFFDPNTIVNQGGFFPGFPFVGASNFASLTHEWILNYNMIDFEMGRLFHISRHLSLRPHVGVMGGWIYQDFVGKTNDNPDNTDNIAALVSKTQNDFKGVGPRIGLNGNWILDYGFSIFGDIAAALLFGKFTIQENERNLNATNAPLGVFVPLFTFTDSFKDLSPHLQMLLGLSWGTCFNNDEMFFRLKAAWETNYWWDQYHITDIIPNLPGGAFTENNPVTMEGLTLEAKLDF